MNGPFWLELLARSAVLLMAGVALSRLIKAQSASVRHRFLLSLFVLLALLPVLSVLLPEIDLPLWRPALSPKALVTAYEISSSTIRTPPGHVNHWPLLLWLAGVVIAASPLLLGRISISRMVRRARPFLHPALQDSESPLASLLLTRTQILVSSELSIPLTCGLIHPRILLPATAEHWSCPRLHAVLLHELAHVERRDVAAQMAAHLIAALWWFQPLIWPLRAKLRAASEVACDCKALESGFRPSEYAAELLAVAKTARPRYALSSSAISMARPCDLEERVRAILSPQAISLPSSKPIALVLALGIVAAAASAVSLHSDPTSQRGSTMKRTFLSALLTSAGLSAATISGSVSDTSGVAVSGVKVVVHNPDTGLKQETVTDSNGKFSVAGAAAGQYILRFEKSGFASIFREFDLKSDSTVTREFTMTHEGAEPIADKPMNSAGNPPKQVRIGGQVAQNNIVSKVQPVYPVAAKQAGIQGVVQIETTISDDGIPIELRVLSSPSDDLSESALEAVRQWRYRPTLLNGMPVEVVTQIIVNYTLSQ